MVTLRVIKTTDGRFRGLILRGDTLEQAIMPLIEDVGDFMELKIINDNRFILHNSNYLIIGCIIK